MQGALTEAATTIQAIWRKQRSRGLADKPPDQGAETAGSKWTSESFGGAIKDFVTTPSSLLAYSPDKARDKDGLPHGKTEPAGLWSGTSDWIERKARQTLNLNGASKDKGLLTEWRDALKRRAMESLVQTGAPVLKRTLGDIGAVIRENAVADPDMFGCVRPIVRAIVSTVWEDVETEIETGLKVAVFSRPEDAAPHERRRHDPASARNCFVGLLLRLRAVILSHYLPCNRSIFGRLRDPWWLFMTLTTCLPVFGIRIAFFTVILTCLLFPGPPDEYQLINFIMIFKGTQFFTTGVVLGFVGAMEYYGCYLFFEDDLRGCISSRGPGATDWLSSLLVDYLGAILLVWTAFLALPMSKTAWHKDHSLHGKPARRVEQVYCCCLKGVVGRGGRLRGLLQYDAICFVLSFAFFVPLYFCSGHDPLSSEARKRNFINAKQTIFWCRILYSLLSLPFVIFVIPGLGKVLTHSVTTGYDASGACVEFAFPKPPPATCRAG